MSKLDLGHPIAQGATANIFLWDEKTVLKRFHPRVPLETVEAEAKRGRIVAKVKGLAAPQVGEIIHREGWSGILFERIDGAPMVELLQQTPWRLFELAKAFASIQHELHQIRAPAGLPDLHQKYARRIQNEGRLAGSVKTKLLNRLKSLPRGQSICHGDLHPGNVMLKDSDGSPVIIDWLDVAIGHPLADVARSVVLLDGAIASGATGGQLISFMANRFTKHYLRSYLRLNNNGGQEIYQQWRPIIAAARLSEEIEAEEEWLIKEAHNV
ncbi:MAG: aminoglycoside phosphotransferase family protein [Chloroflexota bacterium]